MKEPKSNRNKTITLTPGEAEEYINMCIIPGEREITENCIIMGDALTVMGKIPPACVDLLIADPPYNLNKTYGQSKFKHMNDTDYARFTIEWIETALPVLKKTAGIYVCCDWKSSLIIGAILPRYFTVQNRITWQREKGRGAARNWKNSMEDIWFATVSKDKYTFNAEAVKTRKPVIAPYKENGEPKDWVISENGNYRDTYPSNFWDDISVPYWSMPENTGHPTQKPEKLTAKLILASSNPGDLVFDPFLGSGTTAVTAKKLNRRYIGIEKEPEYCALAQKRLETADENPAIQGYTGGVFWQRNTSAMQKRRTPS